MKRLHRPDLYGWSRFDEARNIDFHSVLWVREGGNVVIDPLPLTEHDAHHLRELGGVSLIVVTNSDHVRAAAEIAREHHARVAGPVAEKATFPIPCDVWLADGDEPVPGLTVLALSGSKTAGELALVLEKRTLITGDLVRAHEGGKLCLLPYGKLEDLEQARASVRRLAALSGIEAVITGDGWPIFRHGAEALAELAQPPM
ncbi:MAG: MBL fold metallo-hydrolase [Myxococcales bacterium]|nr:MBL fold metallo-hydrolase [Myxococcales bacterium]MCB9579710.1 MBL fold metallo-hydrolase [Polyangiaceae bacterium]